ncbi:MAG: rimM [Nevskia sp.]|nr:rimM [Nevskia sp.]
MSGNRRVALGRVAGVFGIKGWVKVHSYTRPIENILDYSLWSIAARQPYEAKLLEGRIHGHGLVARITGADGAPIEDRDLAAALLDAEISVEQSQLPKAPAGTWYWSELIGLAVQTVAGEPLGRVTSVFENGAQDVLVIVDGDTERMIPFVQGPIIQSVDTAAGVIVAEWSPEW